MKKCFSIVGVLLIICSSYSLADGSRQGDSVALVAIYNSTNGSGWKNRTNWMTDKPIDKWYGVTMDVNNERVADLTLSNNLLSGSLPREIGNFSGIDNLSLRGNSLTGAIPTEIGNLVLITSLNLNGNNLAGEIPKSIGNLKQLQYLQLADNYLNGPIPSEIGALTNLSYLVLWGNKLTGSIPKEIGNLTGLEVLQLYANELTGEIPKEIGKLTNLSRIEMDDNQLTGSIPKEIGNLQNLGLLNLRLNKLSGPIPPELGFLANATQIELEENQLTGEIPKELGNLTSIEILILRTNKLSGSIPKELGNLKNITTLSLRVNQLSGSIPQEFSQLTTLKSVYLSDNLLTGGIANLPKNSFDSVYVFNNRFNFDELENAVSAKNYRYAPQDSLGIKHDTTLEVNQELHLTALGGESINNSYKWFKNGVEIPTATTKEYKIASAKKADEGIYSYRVTNSKVLNLTLYSRPVTVTVHEEVKGVQEETAASVLTLQPNPASSNISIHTGEYTPASILEIYDMLGTVVQRIETNSSEHTYSFDVSNITPGVYSVRMNVSGKYIVQQFLVSH